MLNLRLPLLLLYRRRRQLKYDSTLNLPTIILFLPSFRSLSYTLIITYMQHVFIHTCIHIILFVFLSFFLFLNATLALCFLTLNAHYVNPSNYIRIRGQSKLSHMHKYLTHKLTHILTDSTLNTYMHIYTHIKHKCGYHSPTNNSPSSWPSHSYMHI